MYDTFGCFQSPEPLETQPPCACRKKNYGILRSKADAFVTPAGRIQVESGALVRDRDSQHVNVKLPGMAKSDRGNWVCQGAMATLSAVASAVKAVRNLRSR